MQNHTPYSHIQNSRCCLLQVHKISRFVSEVDIHLLGLWHIEKYPNAK
jgi:hypothetical protein